LLDIAGFSAFANNHQLTIFPSFLTLLPQSNSIFAG
jgi:hypothetical protein